MASEKITKRGVLIVDPQPHMASLVATMLRSLGRRDLRETSEVAEAQFELRRREFDVIILDDGLTGLDAVEFVRRLRADPEGKNRETPVIMTAVAPDAARIAAARDAGVTEFLRKPFAAVHIKSRLDSIAANPRAFISSQAYTGPDRRRRELDVGTSDRRQKG